MVKEPRDRDSAFDRLLLAAVSAANSGGDGKSCPEPHVMAAYVERTLSKEELAEVEAHVAGCDRCLAALGALLDLKGDEVRGPAAGRDRRPWWKHLWPWMVPLTAAASAAIIYVAVRPASIPGDRPTAELTDRAASGQLAEPTDHIGHTTESEGAQAAGGVHDIGQKTDIVTPAPRTSSASAPPVRAAAPPPTPPGAPLGVPPSAPQVADAGAPSQQAAGAFAPAPPGGAARDEPKTGIAEPSRTETLPRAGTTRAEAPVPSPSAPAAPAPASVAAQRIAANAAQGRESPPAAEGVGRSDVAADLAKVAPRQPFAVSPDRASMWRLPPRGGIERSTDGGRTWQPQASGTEAELLSAHAFDARTCWVVGRDGTVLRTADGEHWMRVTPPVLADFDRVGSAGVLAATVIAVDGRSFRTVDGGLTWRAGQ